MKQNLSQNLRLPVLFSAALLFSVPVHADIVRLKNGKTFEGKVHEEDTSSISIQMGKGSMKVARTDIEWTIPGERAAIDKKAATGKNLLEAGEFLKAGKYDKAVPLLEKALVAAPSDFGIQTSLAYAYARTGQPADAARLYAKASSARPEDEDLRMNLISAYVETRQYREAASLLHRELKIKGATVDVLRKLSLVFHKAGIYTQSIRYAKKASER